MSVEELEARMEEIAGKISAQGGKVKGLKDEVKGLKKAKVRLALTALAAGPSMRAHAALGDARASSSCHTDATPC